MTHETKMDDTAVIMACEINFVSHIHKLQNATSHDTLAGGSQAVAAGRFFGGCSVKVGWV